MDDPIVLVYVGNRDGNERYVLGYPKSNITQSQLGLMAQLEGKSTGAMLSSLLAYTGIWELPVEAHEATPDSFRKEPDQTVGEAAPDKRRRRES